MVTRPAASDEIIVPWRVGVGYDYIVKVFKLNEILYYVEKTQV